MEKQKCMKRYFIIISLLLCVCGLCWAQKSFQPDSTINRTFVLENPESAKLFHPGVADLRIEESRFRPYLFTLFLSSDSTQYLFAYHYEGSRKNQYSAFEMGYVRDLPMGIRHYVSQAPCFATESGLKLGISLQDLEKLKGMNYRKEENNGSWLVYRIDDTTDFCRKYAMPGYEMKVRIRDGKVSVVWFGFEYP